MTGYGTILLLGTYCPFKLQGPWRFLKDSMRGFGGEDGSPQNEKNCRKAKKLRLGRSLAEYYKRFKTAHLSAYLSIRKQSHYYRVAKTVFKSFASHLAFIDRTVPCPSLGTRQAFPWSACFSKSQPLILLLTSRAKTSIVNIPHRNVHRNACLRKANTGQTELKAEAWI